MLLTIRQINNKQTNVTENITSFSKEVMTPEFRLQVSTWWYQTFVQQSSALYIKILGSGGGGGGVRRSAERRWVSRGD